MLQTVQNPSIIHDINLLTMYFIAVKSDYLFKCKLFNNFVFTAINYCQKSKPRKANNIEGLVFGILSFYQQYFDKSQLMHLGNLV